MKHPVLIAILLMGSFTHSPAGSDTTLIKTLLKVLTKTPEYRNYENVNQLNAIAGYIFDWFYRYADTTYFQEYKVEGKVYKNVIGTFGSHNAKTIIVGAHYDVCGNQEGADDNASGVVGLLELARLLANQNLNYRIELVAFTLEEPPYFRTEHMGSYIHAKSLLDNDASVYGMISLEMIGYFSDERKSQQYPLGLLSLFYGNKGNYITVVNKFQKGRFSRKFTNQFRNVATIRTKKFVGPRKLPGIDFSDHLNYWKFGFSAMMITDTAFYRNKNYHKLSDTFDTLDIARMAKVIDGVFETLLKMRG
jgi:Zn-dependent M28 family amino/carboxypeptidase